MFRKLFLDHPKDVGEGYFEHLGVAGRFGLTMMWGGVLAIVHAVFPALCKTGASETIAKLHKTMVEKRGAKRDATVEMLSVEWVI
jgi:Family of unknown function (DUF6356)